MSGKLLIEKYHVLILATGTFCVTYCYASQISIFVLDPKGEFIGKVVDVAAVFVAYALTALTVLPALNDRGSVIKIRNAGLFNTLCGYMSSAVVQQRRARYPRTRTGPRDQPSGATSRADSSTVLVLVGTGSLCAHGTCPRLEDSTQTRHVEVTADYRDTEGHRANISSTLRSKKETGPKPLLGCATRDPDATCRHSTLAPSPFDEAA